MTSENDFSGIYLSYFTAEFGTSLGIFIVNVDSIAGADIGGGIYDGKFEIQNNHAIGTIGFRTTTAGETITGTRNGLPIAYDVPFDFKLPLEAFDYHELETLGGPVNIRFEKIRKL